MAVFWRNPLTAVEFQQRRPGPLAERTTRFAASGSTRPIAPAGRSATGKESERTILLDPYSIVRKKVRLSACDGGRSRLLRLA